MFLAFTTQGFGSREKPFPLPPAVSASIAIVSESPEILNSGSRQQSSLLEMETANNSLLSNSNMIWNTAQCFFGSVASVQLQSKRKGSHGPGSLMVSSTAEVQDFWLDSKGSMRMKEALQSEVLHFCV